MRDRVDLLVHGDVVVTMDGSRSQITDGAIAVRGEWIVAVTTQADAAAWLDADRTIGGPGTVVIPGLVNAHQHLTGDRLIRSTIPDDLPPGAALTDWALPVHAAHTGDDDELSATLSLVEAVTNGITYTVEAGTVAHPERVLAAYDAVGVGGTLGAWGWDLGDGPHVAHLDEVIERQAATVSMARDHPRVDAFVTLVGHDLMSDGLAVAASELARATSNRLTFHLSPGPADARAYLARTGERPVVHLARLGVLGDHVLLAHAVHIDDAELDLLLDLDVAVASCPWAYLRLGQGVTRSFHHPRMLHHGGRVALGCDSENAGDAIDVLLAARLFAGLTKDTTGDPTRFTARAALALATIDGARAIGKADEIGSLEVGKRADIVVVDTTRPEWTPHAVDPITALVWASDGRAIRDVVASGRHVVRDGRCLTVDHQMLAAESRDAHRRLVSRARAHPRDQ
ncbi:MAG: amidohydrolase family protein [Ilumatobacter sp.]|uniref:amidohydrolase family protein n=1 Tax=Ilumatobacter sp. TaxID=1967498 RepID=UPI00260EE904|nr:amidohydrolase family protein [Ilumatobacter sp.]MDJ0767663.1 amidohydrolase family protein [Ilumatobacter sp.]